MSEGRGEFSVYQFFPDETSEAVLRFVDGKTAVEQAHRLAGSVSGRIGTTVCIRITDGGDNCVFEWKFGLGVTHPRECRPGYWMHETSGILQPVVTDYLEGRPLTDEQIATMRAYLRQWISAPDWRGIEADKLRAGVDELTTHAAIRGWIIRAERAGIDPL